MSTKHLREMASGLHDGMGGHADACSDLMEQAAKQIDEMKAKIEQLSARVEVAEAGYQAAIQKAEWQARTNTELNALTLKMAKLVGQCDQLQQQLEAERASLFAESQRKQQLEARVNELEAQELSWRVAYLDERKKAGNLLSALELMLERIQEPPDANCSCHLSPPCNDCVDYGGEREAFEFAKDAIQKASGEA